MIEFEINGAKEKEILDEIKKVPDFDLEYAMMYSPDLESYSEVLYDYYTSLDDYAEKISLSYEQVVEENPDENPGGKAAGNPEEKLVENPGGKALEDCRIYIHAMKSSSALVGALELSGVAKLLEQACVEKNLEMVYEAVPEFVEELRLYKERLSGFAKAYLGEGPAGEEQADMDLVREQLLLLRSALDDFNFDMADSIMKFLSEFSYPADVQDDFNKLVIAVRAVDDDKAKAIIDRII